MGLPGKSLCFYSNLDFHYILFNRLSSHLFFFFLQLRIHHCFYGQHFCPTLSSLPVIVPSLPQFTAKNFLKICLYLGSPCGSAVKNRLPMQETWVQSLGWDNLLEKEMATHSSILAWEIPWTEEPGGLQSVGSQRVGHDLATKPPTFLHLIPLLLKNYASQYLISHSLFLF